MDGPRQVLRGFELSLDERPVDDKLGLLIRKSRSLPRTTCRRIGSNVRCMRSTPMDTASTRLKRRVLGEHGSEHAWDNVSKFP